MLSPRGLFKLLKQKNITPKKSMSQNFLVDKEVVDKLTDVQAGDLILEIGAGLGTLTYPMVQAGAKVIAIEKDPILVKFIKDKYEGKLDVIEEDFRSFNTYKTLINQGQKAKVVANIPYHLTGLIIRRLLPLNEVIESIYIIVQSEVANRCLAKAGSSDYSSFTIFINYYSSVEHIMDIPSQSFYPRPNVNSALLKFTIRPPIIQTPYDDLFTVVRSAFHARRKMLKTALQSIATKREIEAALSELNISQRARAQELTLEDFAKLTLSLCNISFR